MTKYSVVGKSVPRVDARDKAAGRAKYAVDEDLPGCLVGLVLRSPHPHARIVHIDTGRAERLAGVKAILTARDAPLPPPKRSSIEQDKRIFARGRARFVGDELAAVAARDEDTAGEALELIRVEYAQLPAVFTPEDALKPGAPIVPEDGDNIAGSFCLTRGDVDAAFARADHIFQDELETQIQNQCYLEPLSCLASYDVNGRLTIWISSMDPSGVRLCLAQTLGLPEGRVRMIQCNVGGAFGGKITMLPIYPICALLSMKTGRPVKMMNNREEEFIATLPRVPMVIDIKTGFSKDGIFLAKETKVLADNGAYMDKGPRIVIKGTVLPDNVYRVANIRSEGKIVYTNKSAVGAFRGFGTAQLTYALETHLDRVARELGMTPQELRLKNFTRPGDLTAHGWKVGTCGLKECIEEVSQKINFGKIKSHTRGLGVACTAYDCDNRQSADFGGSVAYVKISEEGKVQIISGEADYGQGMRTIFAQMAAEVLGVSMAEVEIPLPDSDYTPFSQGPWALRVTVSGGNAVMLAAEDAKCQLLELAAHMLEANVKDLELAEGKIQVKGSPGKGLSLAEVARYAIFKPSGSAIIGKGVDEPDTNPRDPKTFYGNSSRAYIFGSQVVEVDIDRETGRLKILNISSAHDLGTAINPAAAEGQIEGGIATGLGLGLTEEVLYNQGAVLNPNLVDYKVPTAADMPPIETILVQPYDHKCAFGAKAIGMPGTILPPPALSNAIYDALGVRVNSLPMTPMKILKCLERLGTEV
ncbi:MAG: molybdopterin cofactor-binding domain-containing protein [Thermodesulfobacteriota bacterium]